MRAYLDSQSLIIEIPSNSIKKNIILFSKNNELEKDLKFKKAEEKVNHSNKDDRHNIIKGFYENNCKSHQPLGLKGIRFYHILFILKTINL